MTVTTVIPVRNRPEYIVRAIESVNSQTYPTAQIIVVDDGSTDETPNVVQNIVEKRGNLTLIRLGKNVGAAKARNIGADAASGDFIAFLDSDDVWYPKKLEKQIKEFQADKDVIAVFCGALETTADVSWQHVPPPDISLLELYRSERLGSCSVAVVSRKAFAEIGGFDASLPSCQDWDISIRLAEVGKIRVVQEVLVEYCRHTGERISNNKRDVLIGHDIVFNKIYKRLSDPVLIRMLRGGHESILAEILSGDEPLRALEHAVKAFSMAPSPRKFRALGKMAKLAVLAKFRRMQVVAPH
jgi:glycosyltransferase involved in cell wall biosynthesis